MPLKVVVDHLAGSRRGERQELLPEARIRFGRHPDNEVAFDAHRDIDASARHAELRHEGEAWSLVDVGSSNGTYVGGKAAARTEVTEGVPVEVQFGPNGPRIRLFVGDPDALGEPPPSAIPPTRARGLRRVSARPAARVLVFGTVLLLLIGAFLLVIHLGGLTWH